MDPIANMVIALKNASLASHESVTVPYSKVKFALATALEKAGYVKAVAKKTKKNLQVLEVTLAYNNGMPKISGVERISKPSRRLYIDVRSMKKPLGGVGTEFLSTPKGIMTSREAHIEHVGGEVLLKVW
jgi:small subunit ribosomal protein S8